NNSLNALISGLAGGCLISLSALVSQRAVSARTLGFLCLIPVVTSSTILLICTYTSVNLYAIYTQCITYCSKNSIQRFAQCIQHILFLFFKFFNNRWHHHFFKLCESIT